MNDLRARPHDLCIAEAMPWQQHHEYRTTHPIADIVHDKFFLPVQSQLYAGDSITICRFDKFDAQRRDAKLVEFATVRVVSSAVGSVPVVMAGEIVPVTSIRPGSNPVDAVGSGLTATEAAMQAALLASAERSVDPPVMVTDPPKRGPGRPPKQAEAA